MPYPHAAGAVCLFLAPTHASIQSWVWHGPQTKWLMLFSRCVTATAYDHASRMTCIERVKLKINFKFWIDYCFTYIKSKYGTCLLPFLEVYIHSCALTVTLVSDLLELSLLHHGCFLVYCQTWPFFSPSAIPSYFYFLLTKIFYHGMQTAENI